MTQKYLGTIGPCIDMWSMDREKHVFGYWAEGEVPTATNPPDKFLILVIEPNGNYPGNPSPKDFNTYLNACMDNPDLFCEEEYCNWFAS